MRAFVIKKSSIICAFNYVFLAAVIALYSVSGIYTAEFGWGDYMDEVVYQNSPVHYMANMPTDHPYIEKYNRDCGIVCVGLGAWEDPSTTQRLDQIFREKGIDIWVDFWGYDVNHDWDWWYKQTAYYLPFLMGEK